MQLASMIYVIEYCSIHRSQGYSRQTSQLFKVSQQYTFVIRRFVWVTLSVLDNKLGCFNAKYSLGPLLLTWLNFNPSMMAAIEVCDWIDKFMPWFIMDMNTYPCCYWSLPILVQLVKFAITEPQHKSGDAHNFRDIRSWNMIAGSVTPFCQYPMHVNSLWPSDAILRRRFSPLLVHWKFNVSRHQAIIRTSEVLLKIETLETIFSTISIKYNYFYARISFENIVWKYRPVCWSLEMLNTHTIFTLHSWNIVTSV